VTVYHTSMMNSRTFMRLYLQQVVLYGTRPICFASRKIYLFIDSGQIPAVNCCNICVCLLMI